MFAQMYTIKIILSALYYPAESLWVCPYFAMQIPAMCSHPSANSHHLL